MKTIISWILYSIAIAIPAILLKDHYGIKDMWPIVATSASAVIGAFTGMYQALAK